MTSSELHSALVHSRICRRRHHPSSVHGRQLIVAVEVDSLGTSTDLNRLYSSLPALLPRIQKRALHINAVKNTDMCSSALSPRKVSLLPPPKISYQAPTFVSSTSTVTEDAHSTLEPPVFRFRLHILSRLPYLRHFFHVAHSDLNPLVNSYASALLCYKTHRKLASRSHFSSRYFKYHVI